MISTLVHTFLSLSMWIFGFSSRYLETELGQIHYFEKRAKNEKGILVFVHGIGASAAHYNRILLPLWKAGYTILVPDLPGHGHSPINPKVDVVLNPESFFKNFVQWVDQALPVTSKKFTLIGNSMGGALGLRFAIEHPERLERLILASPAGGFATDQEWQEFKKGIQFKTLLDSKNYLERIYHKIPFYLPIFYPFFLLFMTQKEVKQLIDLCEFEEFQRIERLKGIKEFPPTLVVWGESDRVFPLEHMARFRKYLPGNTLFEVLKEVGHCPQIEDPAGFGKRIQQFVEKAS